MPNKSWKYSPLVLALISALCIGNTYAYGSGPQVNCTMTNQLESNGMPGNAYTSFSVSSGASVYLICVSPDAPTGTEIKAEYFFDDLPSGSPPGSVKSMKAITDATEDNPFIANLSPDMPPPNLKISTGKYHVNISVNGTPIDPIPFDVSN